MDKNQRGFGLVQVLVTVAIMGIVLTAVATMMVTQMQETKAMTEKLAALDFQKSLTSNFAKAGVCSFNLKRASVQIFDSSVNPIPNLTLDSALYSGNSINHPIFVQVGKAASPISPVVIVESIVLSNIRCNTMPCAPATNDFKADIEVRFSDAGLVRSMRPAKTEITLTTTGATSFKTFDGCYGEKSTPISPDTPGTPCTFAGESIPRGIVTYNWSGGGKYCCMADPTTQNISYGAFNNGGFATMILACKGM